LDGSYRLPNIELGHLSWIIEVPLILRKYSGVGNLKILAKRPKFMGKQGTVLEKPVSRQGDDNRIRR